MQADLADLRHRIDERLAELLPSTSRTPQRGTDLVASAIEYGALAPGKRTRPLLMLLAARGLGRSAVEGPMLDIACAVEMVHAASLFLDDMPCMDNARIRRGRPSVHARFGEDVAMLAAVALLAQAWRVAATLADVAPAMRNRLVVVLSDALGLNGLVRGQYRDLREGGAERADSDIAEANHQKTGALFAAALELTGLICGAVDGTLQMLRQGAFELGQAFQLRDDLEDGSETSGAIATKDQHQDDGKSTLVALLGRDRAALRLGRHLRDAEACLSRVLVHDDTAVALLRRAFAQNAPVADTEDAAPARPAFGVAVYAAGASDKRDMRDMRNGSLGSRLPPD